MLNVETGGEQRERRRDPRSTPLEEIAFTMPVVINTDVLDISAGGVLLSTGAEFSHGQRGRLRVLLGEDPFSAAFEVRHVSPGTQAAQERRFLVGAAFMSMDDASRNVLRKFLKTRI